MHSHDDVTEFVIQIGARIDDYYPVTVLRSPAGTGGNGRFPARDFLHGAASPAGPGVPAPGAMRDVDDEDEPRRLPSEQIGRALYEALFTGEIAALFERSLGRTTLAGERLRVRLHLNVGNESIAPLATLPWELMFRHDRRSFLSLSPDTTFVRSLDVPIDLYEPRQVSGPVKVLFVMANPTGDLDLRAERAAIEAAIAEESRSADGAASLVAEFLENATYGALEDKLHRDDFAIIHFMGHGAMSATGEGMLLFQDGLRPGRDLVELLKQEPMTRLVMLNACNTGAASTRSGADPFAGVATALVMAGVPAVIAMQFPVSDAAAVAFSARLYSEIARGRSIEASVYSGRRKIKAMRPDQHEWATPVLFLRDPTLSMRSTHEGTRPGAGRAVRPTGEILFTPTGTSAEPAPPRARSEAAATRSDTGGAPATAAPPQPAAPARPDRPATITGGRVAIGVLALVAVLVGINRFTRPPQAEEGLADTAAAATATDDTTQSDSAASGGDDTTGFDGEQAGGDSASAPLVVLPFESLGAHVDIQRLTMHDSVLTGLSDTVRVPPGESIRFRIPFTITRTAAEGCDGDACSARLHLVTMPPTDGSNVCHRQTFVNEEGTRYRWFGSLKAPLEPGLYPVAIIMTQGAACGTPGDPGNATTLVTLDVH